MWLRAWASLESADPVFAGALMRIGLGRPLTWAGVAKGRGEPMEKASLMLTGMGLLPPDDTELRERRLALVEPLLQAAVGAGRDWAARTAEVTGLEVSVEQEQNRKRARLSEREALLTKLGAPELQGLPTSWRGKTYRRLEQAGDSTGRQRAEEKERARWGREVA